MANRYRGELCLIVDGADRILRYRWAEVERLRDEIGADFDRALNDAAINLDLRVIATALSIGLVAGAPELTPDAVYQASPPITRSLDGIRRALNLAFQGQEEATADPAERPTNGILTRLTRLWRRGRPISEPAAASTASGA